MKASPGSDLIHILLITAVQAVQMMCSRQNAGIIELAEWSTCLLW